MRRNICLVLFLFGLIIQAQSRQVAPVRPGIVSFAPEQARQGETVTIQISGAGFSPETKFVFDPAEGIVTLSTTIGSSSQAQIAIQIDRKAATRERKLFMVFGRDHSQARDLFTIQPALVANPRMTANPNAVRTAEPAGVAASPTPAPQIPTQRTGVQPTGNQPMGTQPDVPITTVQPPQKKTRGGVVNPVLRSSAGELLLPQFNGPVVNLITPSQLRAGSNNVELTIVGSLFTPNTKINFERGIVQVGKPQFVSSS